WLSDPTHIGPSAQVVWLIVGQEILNDPKEIPLPHEFILNRDLLAQLYPSFAEGATPFFTLNWIRPRNWRSMANRYRTPSFSYCNFFFLIAGHMYRTNWGIGHDRVLRHRDAIISHLNWACIFLGFHSFGLYIHNDTMSALGRPQNMFLDTAIQLQHVFAQWIQNTHALTPSATAPGATASTSLTWGGAVALLPIPLGTADFLVHHIHAFTIHVTILILLKGVLFARSSRLIPDKANLGFRFPYDGPGRGGGIGPGYWQELIESIIWAHNKLKVASATQPRALSIVQGRVVGVTHYLLGGIATTWAFFLARIIAVG
ncbi:hypothetical protein M8C21_025794, partial [Ambrosia artemisiifolia]